MAFETVGVKVTLEGVAAFERGMLRVERSMIRTGRQILTAEERSRVFNKTLNRMGIALAATGGAALAFIFSATRLAARVQTLGVVTVTLGRNVGKTEQEIRDLEDAVKAQGITLRGTRRAIALMIQSQIDLSNATELARLAQNAAVIANINSTEAFERLVFVIVSGNVRMARTLGLQVSFQQAYVKTAEALDKNVTELTQLEKTQARTNAVLATGVTIAGAYEAAMETAGKKVLSLDRHLEESRRILGEAWLPIYAEAVDFVTKTLKAWENLDEIQQATTSTTIGFVAAITALVGISFIAIPKVIALGGAFTTLATAIFGTGGIIFSATALLGIWVVAISAAVIAVGSLVKSLATWKKQGDAIDDAIREQINTLNKAEVSQEQYEAEIRRLSDVTNRAVISQEEYNKLIAKGGLFARAAEKSIVLQTEAQRRQALGIDVVNISAAKAARALKELGDAEKDAAEEAKKLAEETERLAELQKELADRLQFIKQLASVDLTKAFEEYRTKVEDLNATIEKLESRDYLTRAQQEDLATARAELEKTNQAWRTNTAVVLLSLFEQAIAIGGLTQEEIIAFAKLQEQLGLVDKGYAALTLAVFGVAAGLDESGDQVDDTVDDMFDLFLALIDPTLQAEDLADEIDRLKSKQVRIDVLITTSPGADPDFDLPPTPPPPIRRIVTETGARVVQKGGPVQRGRLHIVGEAGPEFFVPGQSGTVLPNSFVRTFGIVSSLLRGIAPMLTAARIAAPAANVSSVNSQTTNNFNLNVATQATREPIIADFRSMQAIVNA